MQAQKYIPPCKFIPSCSSIQGFQKLVVNSSGNKQQLFERIRTCKLDQLKVRFNVWRMVFGIISIDSPLSDKIQQVKDSRTKFKEKHRQAFTGIIGATKKQGNIAKNPLMKAMNKPDKVEINSDEFLREEIKKDVDRTYQEMEFFQDENILKLLSNVLFVWCKKNPEVSYKQGMNQILASVVYVYFQQTYFENRKPVGWGQAEDEYIFTQSRIKEAFQLFNSIQYAEADIYEVFEKVMDIQQDMYKTETDSAKKGSINPNSKNNTPILQRIIDLRDHKLKTLDLELFRILKLQDVQTKTFLLRWIRCMHTREFSLECSFVIWDSIFLDYYEWPGSKEKGQFEFIDAMCLAMFIYMRSIVLTRETSYEILQIYQKYPQIKLGGYLEELLTIAWSVCEALRQPANSQGDWYGSQATQNNAKLQFMKNKELKQEVAPKVERKEKQFPKSPNALLDNKRAEKPQPIQQEVKPKEPEPKPELKPIENSPKKQTPFLFPKKQSHREEIVKRQIQKEEIVQGKVQPLVNEKFAIVLQAEEWKEMKNLLSKAIKKEEDWMKNCSKAVEILDKKIAFTQSKLQ